jgi:NAD(P) transhydrogenase subunit alpha
VRPEAREQVASVGGRFVELPLEGATGEGGYARAMDETYYRRQRELLTEVLQASEVAITTAQVPDGPAPLLLTRAMMAAMPKGSVVVDLAANQGGNCEGVLPDQTVMVGATMLVGAGNLPGTIAVHASQMLGRNMQAILTFLAPRGQLALDDEVIQAMVVTRDGAVVHRGVAQRLSVQPADDNTAGEERP